MYICIWESIDKYKRMIRIKEQALNRLSLAKMDSRNVYVASMDYVRLEPDQYCLYGCICRSRALKKKKKN